MISTGNGLFNSLRLLPYHRGRSLRLASSTASSLTNGYVTLIGLEIHAQINATSKLFSRSPQDYSSPPNINVSLFDCSIPGTLPIINRYCVEATVKSGLALNCQINSNCLFDRKHYFYPDSPSGFQITQKRDPIAFDGYLQFIVPKPKEKTVEVEKVRLKAVQLEQDTGKSLKDIKTGANYIDLNRCGVGLMEFVFEPDLDGPYEAVCMVKELISILKRLDTCTCKMDEGALRIDANISVSSEDNVKSNRVELKNLNSIHSLYRGIEYESERHIKALKEGLLVPSETRFYDPIRKKTFPMREKDNVEDYRYMPEPNLPPLRLAEEQVNESSDEQIISINELKDSLPMLPEEERIDLVAKYGIDVSEAAPIVANDLYRLYCDIMATNPPAKPKKAAVFIGQEFSAILRENETTWSEVNLSPDFIRECLELCEHGVINVGTAQDVIELALHGDSRSPREIVIENGWRMIQDEQIVKEACLKYIDLFPVAAYNAKRANPFSLEFLSEQVIKELGMKITKNVARYYLKLILDGRDLKVLKKAALLSEKQNKEGEDILQHLQPKKESR